MSDQVGNHEDRFSHNEAHIKLGSTSLLNAPSALLIGMSRSLFCVQFSHEAATELLTASWENLSSGIPTRSDTKRAVQPQKMARNLKVRIEEVEMVLSMLHSSENNGADQLRAYCAGETTP